MIFAAPSPFPGKRNTLVIGGRMDGDRALLTPRGELVHGSADTLDRKLSQLPARTDRIDLDMSGVRFMDTAGLRFLDVLRDHSGRRSVPVTATRWNGQPRRILVLVGLDPADPLCPVDAPVPAPGPARQTSVRVRESEVEELRREIAARPAVDRARGVLMATHGCDSDTAWHILRETSKLSRVPLRAVAVAVTADTDRTGSRPPREVREALATTLARRLR